MGILEISNIIILLIGIVLVRIYFPEIKKFLNFVLSKSILPTIVDEKDLTIARIHMDHGYRAISFDNGKSIKDKFNGFSIWDNSKVGDAVRMTAYSNGRIKYVPSKM